MTVLGVVLFLLGHFSQVNSQNTTTPCHGRDGRDGQPGPPGLSGPPGVAGAPGQGGPRGNLGPKGMLLHVIINLHIKL